MYGTQCNNIISNIVFIWMFFTLFSNRMISFFLPFTVNCSQVAMFQIMPALCPHGQGDGGGRWSTKCGQAWTGGRGVSKFPNLCGYRLCGWPLFMFPRRTCFLIVLISFASTLNIPKQVIRWCWLSQKKRVIFLFDSVHHRSWGKSRSPIHF